MITAAERVVVSVDAADLEEAAAVARARLTARTIFARSCRRRVEDGSRDAINLIGALAELAWARYAGTPWDARVYTFPDMELIRSAWDVCGVCVRATNHLGGRLLVHDEDPDRWPFVLAIVSIPEIRFAGFMSGCEAKRRFPLEKLHPDKPACHAVPEYALLPVGMLLARTALELLGKPHTVQRHPATAQAALSVPAADADNGVSVYPA